MCWVTSLFALQQFVPEDPDWFNSFPNRRASAQMLIQSSGMWVMPLSLGALVALQWPPEEHWGGSRAVSCHGELRQLSLALSFAFCCSHPDRENRKLLALFSCNWPCQCCEGLSASPRACLEDALSKSLTNVCVFFHHNIIKCLSCRCSLSCLFWLGFAGRLQQSVWGKMN